MWSETSILGNHGLARGVNGAGVGDDLFFYQAHGARRRFSVELLGHVLVLLTQDFEPNAGRFIVVAVVGVVDIHPP